MTSVAVKDDVLNQALTAHFEVVTARDTVWGEAVWGSCLFNFITLGFAAETVVFLV